MQKQHFEKLPEEIISYNNAEINPTLVWLKMFVMDRGFQQQKENGKN